ncbi:hypothetical protein PVK06_023902 [Gossypium arboreum]|uniref:DEAD-box RNA helicase Q domain-containing protein n=1 Tax=Gossypium arboreum TaxID=29729 RepID=A0ABR0PCR1_GOSAR|nr:hypothetical protein PVK06_023902 [Gossypium arboreum]
MEALLSQFTFLSDQALQGNKNFDPSAMEDLMKLFEIESYKAWAALELVEEKQVKGAEITMPILSFDQMGLKDDLLCGIYNYGFEKPSTIQQRAVMPIINGRDVIAQAQSGTEKTSMIALTVCQVVDTASREYDRIQTGSRNTGSEIACNTNSDSNWSDRGQAGMDHAHRLTSSFMMQYLHFALEVTIFVAVFFSFNQRKCLLSGALIILHYLKLKKAAIATQCAWRGRVARKELRKLNMAVRETGALQAAKNKLENQVEKLTWRLQLEKRMRSKECLRKERERVSNYLHSSSETKLLEKVQHELLVTYANRLLEKEHSGCRALLRDDKVEDLSRMYRLYCKIPRGLEPVANVFKQHVTAEGTALVQQAEDAVILRQPHCADGGLGFDCVGSDYKWRKRSYDVFGSSTTSRCEDAANGGFSFPPKVLGPFGPLSMMAPPGFSHGRWWEGIPPDVVVLHMTNFRVSHNLFDVMDIGSHGVGLTRPIVTSQSFGPHGGIARSNGVGHVFRPHDTSQRLGLSANFVSFRGPPSHEQGIGLLDVNDVGIHRPNGGLYGGSSVP